MDTVTDLFVSSLLDDLFQRMYTIFGILGWLYDPRVHKADLLQQIVSKVIVSGLKFGRPLHYMSWCDDRLMARVLLVSPNDGGVHGHEAMNQALLSPKYVPPRISPCLRRVDDLGIANYESIILEGAQAVTYFGKHLVGIVKIFQQDPNLSFIGCPRQELAKASLHGLHLSNLEYGKIIQIWLAMNLSGH